MTERCPLLCLHADSISSSLTMKELVRLISHTEFCADALSDFENNKSDNYYYGDTKEEIILQLVPFIAAI